MHGMPPLVRHNARQLYFDIFWYGVLAGSAVAFLAVYAARLGATSLQIGLLTAGPAVINLFVSLPAARWLEGRSLTRIALNTSIWHRAGYLAFVVLPWLAPPALQAILLPAVVILMSVPGTILAIAFNAMFADVVPPEWRGAVVGRRNALLALSMAVTSLFAGWVLRVVAFPTNYQLVFGLGVLGAAMSSYYLARLRPVAEPPPRVGQPLLEFARPGTLRFADAIRLGSGMRFLARGEGQRLLRLDLLRGPFAPFLFVFFAFYTFQFTPVPIVPLFWVRELELTDSAISVGNALFHAVTLMVSLRLEHITQRIGHHRVLAVSAILFGVYPLLIGLATDATLFWVASLLGGAVWGLAAGGLVTRLMERVPADDRPAHMALHNLALNLGILAGSFLGPVLADWLGLRSALLLSAGLRLLGGILLAIWG